MTLSSDFENETRLLPMPFVFVAIDVTLRMFASLKLAVSVKP